MKFEKIKGAPLNYSKLEKVIFDESRIIKQEESLFHQTKKIRIEFPNKPISKIFSTYK